MLCLPPLGLIFRVMMSTNQETSDIEIFLQLSVIVMKHSFKSNHGEPLCDVVSKKIRCDIESKEERGWKIKDIPRCY